MPVTAERLKALGYTQPQPREPKVAVTPDRLRALGYPVEVQPLQEKASPSSMPTEQQLYEQELQKQLQARSGWMMDYLPGPLKDVASAAAGYASDMAGIGLRGSAAVENTARSLIPDSLEGAAGFVARTALPGLGHVVLPKTPAARKKLDLANDLQTTSEVFDQEVEKARGNGVIGWARKMGTGALRSGANMLTGALLGGPYGAVAMGGLTEASQKYGELERKGASEAEQLGWATAAGVWESTVGAILNKVFGGNEKLIGDALKGIGPKLWKMPLKDAAKEVLKAQGKAQVDEQITEQGHLAMSYADGTRVYSPDELLGDILRTARDTAMQTAMLTAGAQTTTQLGARAAEKRQGETPFGPGQTPPVPPQTPPAAPVTPQTPRPSQRGGLNPPTTPRPIPREELEAIRAKGPVSRKDGQKIGLTPEQMDNQETRTKAVDELIQQEKQNAAAVPQDQSVPEEAGRPGQGPQVPSGGDLRGTGKEQVPAQPASQVPPARTEGEGQGQGLAQKEPWEMSRSEHESSSEKKGDGEWDAFKTSGVTVVKNPKSSDLRDMAKEFRDKFPSAPADSVKVRSTFDAEGNKYSWMSDATHADIEPEINKRYGTTTNQNKVEGIPHRYVVAEAIANGKRVPTEVLREYKESLPGMLSAAREKSGEGSVHPDVVADFIEITGANPTPAPTQPVEAPQTETERFMADLVGKMFSEEAPVEAPPVKSKGRERAKKKPPVKSVPEAVERIASRGEQESRGTVTEAPKAGNPELTKAGVTVKQTPKGWSVSGITQETFDEVRQEYQGRKRGRNFVFQRDPSEGIVNSLRATQEEARRDAEAASRGMVRTRIGELTPEEAQAFEQELESRLELERQVQGDRNSDVENLIGQFVPSRRRGEFKLELMRSEDPDQVKGFDKIWQYVQDHPELNVPHDETELFTFLQKEAFREDSNEEAMRERIANEIAADMQETADDVSFDFGANEKAPAQRQTAIAGFEEEAANAERNDKARASRGQFTSNKGKQKTFLEDLKGEKYLPGQQTMFETEGLPQPDDPGLESSATKAKREALDKARKDFLGGTSSTGFAGFNPELAVLAGKYIKAAVEYRFSQFKDLMDYVVRQEGPRKAKQLDEYLRAGWKSLRAQKGFEGLDEPPPAKAPQKRPVRKQAPVETPKEAPKTNWQDSVLSALSGKTKVADAVELPTLWAQVEKANPGLTMEEFKQGLLAMHEAGQVKLEDETGSWEGKLNNPLAIRGKDFDEKRGYGLKWWVRGVEGAKPTQNPAAPPKPKTAREAREMMPEPLRDESGMITESTEDYQRRVGVSEEGVFLLGSTPRTGHVYRGISRAELKSIIKSGKVKSRGTHNLGGRQEGKTLYSILPAQATNYASTFAPKGFYVRQNRPGYVIEVRQQEGMDPPRNGEVEYAGEVPISEITRIWEIRPKYDLEGMRGSWADYEYTDVTSQYISQPVESPVKNPVPPPVKEVHPEPPKTKPPVKVDLPFPQMTGIKMERLNAQADALGMARPNPGESMKVLERVEQRITELTPEIDAKIIERASEAISNPSQPISEEDAIDRLASTTYHMRQATAARVRYSDYMEQGNEEAALRAEDEENSHKGSLYVLQQAARLGGTKWAHIGHIYQTIVDTDNQAYIESQLRKANRGQLSDEDKQFAKDTEKKLNKAKDKQAKRGKQIDEEKSAEAVDSAKKDLENELKRERTQSRKGRGSKNRFFTQEAKDAALERIRKRRSEELAGKAFAAPIGRIAKDLADASIVAGYVVESGARRFADFSRDMIQELGDWVQPHLAELHRKARAEYAKVRLEELSDRLKEVETTTGQHQTVASLAKEILAETRKEDGTFISRDELLSRLHEELSKVNENITPREVQDMLGGYGKFRELSKDELEVQYRNYHGEARELSKIDDLQHRTVPPVSGQEMHTPSDEERRLTKQVTDLKKEGEREGWYHQGDKEQKLKGTLDAQKRRLENEIRDIDAQIAAGEKTVRSERVPLTDDELEMLRDIRAERKQQFDEVFGVPELTDEQRAERYERQLEARARQLREQLASGKVFPGSRKAMPTSQRITEIKAEIEALKAEKDLMRKILDPNFETNQKVAAAEKQAEREIAKLEKEQAEGFKMRGPKETLPVTEKLRQARERLKALRDARMDALENEYLLKAAIANSKRNTAKVRERIAKGDFAPRTRPEPRVWNDPEWKKAKDEENAARLELAKRISQYEFQNQTFFERTGFVARVGANILKALLTSFDVGSLGLQLGFVAGSHPIIFTKALVPTLKATLSKKAYLRIAQEMQADPDFEKFKKWGLSLSDHSGTDPASMAEYMPVDRFTEGIPGIAMSGRNFATSVNQVRFNVMKVLVWSYSKDGRTLSKDRGEALARLVNAITFGWNPKEQWKRNTLQGAGVFLWAPSMYAARLQVLAGTPVWLNKGADARIRKMAAMELVKGAVAMYVLNSLWKWLWAKPDDEDEDLTWTDPDFYKAKKGDIRVDNTAGLGQNLTLAARVANSTWKAWTGNDLFNSSNKRPMTTRDIFGSFMSYKLAPWITFMLNMTSDKDILGRPTSVGSIAAETFVPLSVQNAVESVEEAGLAEGSMLSVWGATGHNVSIYNKNNPRSQETFLATAKRLIDQMTGAPPAGISEEEFKKWSAEKITWKTDVNQFQKMLSPAQLEKAKEVQSQKRGELIFEAFRDSPDERVAAAKAKKQNPYKDAESLRKAQEAFQKDQASFSALRSEVSLDEAERLLAVRYAAEKGTEPIQVNGQWLPTGSNSQNKAFIERRNRLRAAYGK